MVIGVISSNRRFTSNQQRYFKSSWARLKKHQWFLMQKKSKHFGAQLGVQTKVHNKEDEWVYENIGKYSEETRDTINKCCNERKPDQENSKHESIKTRWSSKLLL